MSSSDLCGSSGSQAGCQVVRDSLSAHELLVPLMGVLRRFSPYPDLVHGASNHVETDQQDETDRESTVFWRLSFDKLTALSELAFEAGEPWKQVPRGVARGAIQNVSDFLVNFKKFLGQLAAGIIKPLRATRWNRDDEEWDSATYYLTWLRSEIGEYRNMIRDLSTYVEAVSFCRKQIEAGPDEKFVEELSGPCKLVYSPVQEHRSTVKKATVEAGESLTFVPYGAGAFFCAYEEAWNGPYHGIGWTLGLMKQRGFSRLILAARNREESCNDAALRERMRVVWRDGVDTIRRLSEMALFDVDDMSQRATDEMAVEAAQHTLRFTDTFREFWAFVLDTRCAGWLDVENLEQSVVRETTSLQKLDRWMKLVHDKLDLRLWKAGRSR